MDAGLDLVAHLYQRMKIDDEWAVRTDRGFTWWSGELAQTIWAEEAIDDDGFLICEVHAETDLLAKPQFTSGDFGLLGMHGTFATMSGHTLVEGGLKLASKVYVHDGTLEMWKHVFLMGALLQVVTAYLDVGILCQMTEADPAVSEHPDSGPRTDRDDMLEIVAAYFAPEGQKPSAFAGRDLLNAKAVLERGPSLLTNGDETGLTAEFPFGNYSSLFQMTTEERNPRLGNGLLVRLTPPNDWEAADLARRALEVNTREATSFTKTPFLGSWCPAPNLPSSLTFVSFLPNVAFHPGFAASLGLYGASRSRWVLEEVVGGSLEESRKTARPQFGLFDR